MSSPRPRPSGWRRQFPPDLPGPDVPPLARFIAARYQAAPGAVALGATAQQLQIATPDGLLTAARLRAGTPPLSATAATRSSPRSAAPTGPPR